jgi:drug/metabolite transporter (DMT)-like permease
MIGYLFLFISIVFTGLSGIVSKISETKKCNPMASSGMLFLWAAALMFCRLLFTESNLPRVPPLVLVLAIPFGFMAGIALVAFLFAIEYGKIATSWLVVSLSSIVPAVASILIYKESPQKQKAISLLLIGASLTLLYLDKGAGQETQHHTDNPMENRRATLKWLRLMILVFFCAAMGAFPLKVLQEARLSDQYRDEYLFYRYLAGFLIAAVILVIKRIDLRRKEIAVGAFLGVSSLLSNLFLSLALAQKIAGYIAFPVVGIGSTLVVMAAGLLIFHERLTRYGYAGVGLGLLALLLVGI